MPTACNENNPTGTPPALVVRAASMQRALAGMTKGERLGLVLFLEKGLRVRRAALEHKGKALSEEDLLLLEGLEAWLLMERRSDHSAPTLQSV